MSTNATLPPLYQVPEIQAAAAEAAAAGNELYIDYVVPRHDRRIDIYIEDHNILVPYVIIHREKVLRLTVAQLEAWRQGTYRFNIPYSASYVPVMIPATGEIRQCFVDAYVYQF